MREWGRFRRWIDSGREEVRLHRRLACGGAGVGGGGPRAELPAARQQLAQSSCSQASRRSPSPSSSASSSRRAGGERARARASTATEPAAQGPPGGAPSRCSAGDRRRSARARIALERAARARVALGRELGAEAVSQPRIDSQCCSRCESLKPRPLDADRGRAARDTAPRPSVIGTFTMPIKDRPQEVKVSPDGSAPSRQSRTTASCVCSAPARTNRSARSRSGTSTTRTSRRRTNPSAWRPRPELRRKTGLRSSIARDGKKGAPFRSQQSLVNHHSEQPEPRARGRHAGRPLRLPSSGRAPDPQAPPPPPPPPPSPAAPPRPPHTPPQTCPA